MACLLEDRFIEGVIEEPPFIWALRHMEECPTCAAAYEIVSALREAEAEDSAGIRPIYFLDGLEDVPKQWLLWMSGDKPLFPTLPRRGD